MLGTCIDNVSASIKWRRWLSLGGKSEKLPRRTVAVLTRLPGSRGIKRNWLSWPKIIWQIFFNKQVGFFPRHSKPIYKNTTYVHQYQSWHGLRTLLVHLFLPSWLTLASQRPFMLYYLEINNMNVSMKKFLSFLLFGFIVWKRWPRNSAYSDLRAPKSAHTHTAFTA